VNVRIHDVTLRDGNHALRHSLTVEQVRDYCRLANQSGVDSVEVGHGNGLGASSFLVGKATTSDFNLLATAKAELTTKKLGVHVIPGFATFDRDVKPALEIGVDSFRVAAHVTEADVCAPHIERLASESVEVFGVLMMSHMASPKELVAQVAKIRDYGAEGLIFMDSAGAFVPDEVSSRVAMLKSEFGPDFLIGFHAHNNLGFGLSNALAAKEAGADILDGSAAGLGAGAGNVHLELIATSLFKAGKMAEADFEGFAALAEHIEAAFEEKLPRISSQSVRSGLAGAFSGYSPQVKIASSQHNIPPQEIWKEIGKRKLVAGQESVIWEIAQDLANL
jgi:4-hydroxy 2-oxovalerate aldolase